MLDSTVLEELDQAQGLSGTLAAGISNADYDTRSYAFKLLKRTTTCRPRAVFFSGRAINVCNTLLESIDFSSSFMRNVTALSRHLHFKLHCVFICFVGQLLVHFSALLSCLSLTNKDDDDDVKLCSLYIAQITDCVSIFLTKHYTLYSAPCANRSLGLVPLCSACLSVCLSEMDVHCDHTVHVSADLSLWLDISVFWAP